MLIPFATRTLLITCVLAPAPVVGDQAIPEATYQYAYPYSTPELNEDHFIVLGPDGGRPRGWYYGTSDEFDQAREGYLPGFFVAPMQDLELTPTTIAFTLFRPARLFVAPVPLEYRDATTLREDLEEWGVPLPVASRRYVGVVRGEEIELEVPGGPRIFRRIGARP